MSETLTIVLSIAAINVAMFGCMLTLGIWAVNKLDSDIQSLSARMDASNNRLDGHAKRIDQLYSMFLSIQNEIKELYGKVCVMETKVNTNK
ncbi:MAG: hypothetical protein ACYC0F_18575 [Rhodanobacter sp.]